ncbi:hypothetical protein [Deinococcus pimensis]|uniref:hypothetical protein n=1 Tax=Deinococcus pimensis TaxID=309888 RepID=UPI000482BA07|nr:hypothetical protein [Deinococcus pimensis]
MSRFILRGRWHGSPLDSERHFEGTVVEAGHTGLHEGAAVSVTWQADVFTLMTRPAHAHGSYRLGGMPSDRFVLASFVRKDGEVGRDAVHDGEEQLWGGEIYS